MLPRARARPQWQNMKLQDLGSVDVQKTVGCRLSTVIEKGKKAMPGYESKPTKDEISGVVEYIRSLKLAALSANFEPDSDAFPW